MASARNAVISGDHKGAFCGNNCGGLELRDVHFNLPLTKETIKNYTILDAEERKSGSSAVMRAGVGALLLGPIGLAAGLSAKRKGIYTIAIEFKNGERSLIEIDEKYYKKFIEDMF